MGLSVYGRVSRKYGRITDRRVYDELGLYWRRVIRKHSIDHTVEVCCRYGKGRGFMKDMREGKSEVVDVYIFRVVKNRTLIGVVGGEFAASICQLSAPRETRLEQWGTEAQRLQRKGGSRTLR
jgi:hypothetical protein